MRVFPRIKFDRPVAQSDVSLGPTDVVARAIALVMAAGIIIAFIVGTIYWTKLMTDTFSPLGYAMTPIGMYGIAIILIPLMGIAHRLWTVGDLRKKEGDEMKAERDRLRTSLLGAPDRFSGVRAAPPPENLIFGEDEDEIRRRRRQRD